MDMEWRHARHKWGYRNLFIWGYSRRTYHPGFETFDTKTSNTLWVNILYIAYSVLADIIDDKQSNILMQWMLCCGLHY
mgnify:CR=1 FL=1